MAGKDIDACVPREQLSKTFSHVSHVIFDLDGTLLDTESLVDEVLEEVVARYGKEWDGRGAQKRLGKRPLEASVSVVEDYELPCSALHFNNEVVASLQSRWVRARPLPGAVRLVKHLHDHCIPVAIASRINLLLQVGRTTFQWSLLGIWSRMESLLLIYF